MKVVTVVGTRPEIIRLSRTIALLDQVTDHTLLNTGQNSAKQLNQVFFDDLGIRDPDHWLDCDGSDYATFVADSLVKVDRILEETRPDAFLILGDTNSALTALAAKRRGIPVFHLEAGNRAFDRRIPEEINRRVIDHLADFNFPYSEAARRNLLDENLEPRRVLLTGSPLPEIAAHYREGVEQSGVLARLGLEKQQYILVSAHRAENVDSPQRLESLMANLKALHETFKAKVLVSTHPRTRNQLDSIGFDTEDSSIIFHEPFGFFDYIHLQNNAMCVLSDSGTVSEEAAVFGFPAVTIRGSMERPEALEAGVLAMCDVSSASFVPAALWAIAQSANREVPAEYQVQNFSHRVVNAIISLAPLHRTWSGLN